MKTILLIIAESCVCTYLSVWFLGDVVKWAPGSDAMELLIVLSIFIGFLLLWYKKNPKLKIDLIQKVALENPLKFVVLGLTYWNLAYQFYSSYDTYFSFEELFGIRFVLSVLAIPAAHLMFMVMDRLNTKKQGGSSQELPQEVRRVFDRMVTGKESPTQQEVQKAKERILNQRQQKPGP